MRTLHDFASGYVSEVHDMLDKLDLGSLEAVIEVLANCEGIVWLAGNGGSWQPTFNLQGYVLLL
jgi:hypothetical protein